MGKYRPVIFLGAAIIVALVTSYLIYNYLQKRTAPKEAALETQPVAVAIVNLPWGTSLKKEMIKLEPYLKKSLPSGYFSDLSTLEGRVVISPIALNEPILQSRLAPTDLKTGGVAAVLKPKNRAVAVRVDKVIGVAGFISPGNRVDVLVTIEGGKGIPEAITKIVLENILVLATGAEVQKTGKEAQASPVDVITLEVTPEETEKLAHAATQGKLQLALRNYQDTEDVLTRGAKTPALLSSYSGVGEAPKVSPKQGKRVTTVKAPSPVQPAVFSVEVVRGGQSSKVNFEGR